MNVRYRIKRSEPRPTRWDKILQCFPFHGSRPVSAGGAKTRRPATPRPRYVLEPLEPRLLMSADISYLNHAANNYTLNATGPQTFALDQGASSVGTAISPRRCMMSQVFRVPVTVNSLGPFIVL